MYPGSCPFPQRRSSWTGKKAAPAWLSARSPRKDGLEVAWPVIFHQGLQINPEANGSYGMDVFRANDEGDTYRTGFATGKSGNSLCGYVGFYSPDNQVINALYLWEDRTSLEMPLAVGGGGTGATTPSSARTNLGLMKKLWSGNWASGNITAEGFQDYTLFFLHPYGGAHSIIAMKVGNTLRGIGGQAGDGNQTILTLQATCNGNTLSGLECFWINHAVSGDHGAKTDVGIADIYGVC